MRKQGLGSGSRYPEGRGLPAGRGRRGATQRTPNRPPGRPRDRNARGLPGAAQPPQAVNSEYLEAID
jgi:hypothetical protein